MIRSTFIILLAFVIAPPAPAAFAAEQAAPKKIVLIAGKKSHGPEGNRIHDYPWSVRLLKVMLEQSNIADRIKVETVFGGWPKDPAALEGADTIMVISDGRDGDLYEEAEHLSSADRVAEVDALMKRGCGLIVFHFSTFAPDKYADMILRWTGGYFDWEENGRRKWYSAIRTMNENVELADAEHEVLRGVKPFRMNEEFYYNLRFKEKDDATKPVLTVPALKGREPDGNVVAWVRQRTAEEGGGRGFGTTCGHFYDNWKNDDFRKLILNAIAWTAKVQVPVDGVEAKYVEREEITKTLAKQTAKIYRRDNLVAWCIVPFDGKKRGPKDRAEMLADLGFRKFAYDWRNEHIPTFDAEMEELKKRNIELTAFWFPGSLNKEARAILDVLKRHDIRTQLWITGGDPAPGNANQNVKVKTAADQIRPIALEAAKIGCTVALYNHGGWFGEPENQIAIIKELNLPNVGIVYNFHHGHDQIERFPDLLKKMLPHLHALNLNGMVQQGDRQGKKILPLGAGDLELGMMKLVADSGYSGPIGILGHTSDDARERLADNLDGFDWLLPQLAGLPAGEKPKYRTWNVAAKPAPTPAPRPAQPTGAESMKGFGKALTSGMVVENKDEYRKPPITVELWAKLNSRNGYNILVASDTKQSAAHWELFSMSGNGLLTLYIPGSQPDHVKTTAQIADGRWHHIAMIYEPTRVRLFADGKQVADQAIQIKNAAIVPGGLAFARLVEGNLGCDGSVDNVRISKGVREIKVNADAPMKKDENTLGLWDFDDLKVGAVSDGPSVATLNSYWSVEDPAERAKLPEYVTIPAARPEELTPSNGFPKADTYRQWTRSHGDAGAARYGGFDQINRDNVGKLKVAWTYHSGDGRGNIQCNPVIVDGVMYAPTVGNHVVAINAETGVEIWRYKPVSGRPAHRGLLYWAGDGRSSPRIMFTSGAALYALDPRTGNPIKGFGKDGIAPIPGPSVAGPAVAKGVVIIPGEARDAWGFDAATGRQLWTFHTIPRPGEFGHDTWDRVTSGANCWGGMSADEERGIAYITTGSPKPNFMGMLHRGDNLFANCVIAIDVLTGKRLWHFQELRHDIWDLDVPAPANLVTINVDGKKIDAIAAVTKIGNTLLLDRTTGRPIFPFRLRRAPAGKLPGERTAPYQPDLELPQPFAKRTFTLDDVTDISPEARQSVLGQLKNATMGWSETFEENKPMAFFGIHGGAEWTGASIDPTSGRLYVSSNEIPWIITLVSSGGLRPAKTDTPGEKVYLDHCVKCHGQRKEGVGVNPSLLALDKRMKDEDVLQLMATGRNLMPPAAKEMTQQQKKDLLDFLFDRDLPASARSIAPRGERPSYAFLGFNKLQDAKGFPGSKPPWGTLNCIDLNTGKLLWKVPLGEYAEFAYDDIPRTGTENFGGAMATAGGLVFCAGTRDEKIRAFDAQTGKELWEHKLPFGGYAPPATYMAGGKQYVVIPATGGGKLGGPMGDAYVAFALP